jgi:hypothetical protein
MGTLVLHKVISSLPPAPYTPDSIYLVRVGTGFDIYATDSEGVAIFKANTGSAGSASFSSAQVEVTPAAMREVTVVVADASVTTSSKIMCSFAPSEDWDADDLDDFRVFATPLDGQIAFSISAEGPIVGTFTINYQLG